MTAPREVYLHNAHPRLKLKALAVVKVIHFLDANKEQFRGGCPPGELSLAFLTDPALAALHGNFLADPTTTDVMTFEGNRALQTAGEICVSVDTAQTYAKTHRRDFSEELTLYLVHGWLHLAAYDDVTPAKKRQMRAAEKRAMACLRLAGILPTFSFQTRRG